MVKKLMSNAISRCQSLYFKIIRNYIREFIVSANPFFSGVVVDLGCGESPYRKEILRTSENEISSYLRVDIEDNNYHSNREVDIFWDGKLIPLDNESVNCILLTEVLEHLPNPKSVFIEMRRILKSGGYIILTFPFIFPLHEPPSDFARYTPYYIKLIANTLDLDVIEMERFGGWNRSLAHLIGLWLQSKQNNVYLASILHLCVLPLYLLLIMLDSRKARNHHFNESMFIGLGVILRKP